MMKFLENIDLAKCIDACGDFVAQLDKHPLGACFFVVVTLIVCVAWRWPSTTKGGKVAKRKPHNPLRHT